MERVIFRIPVPVRNLTRATECLALAKRGDELADIAFKLSGGLKLKECLDLKEKSAKLKLMAAQHAGFATVQDMEYYLEIYKEL